MRLKRKHVGVHQVLGMVLCYLLILNTILNFAKATELRETLKYPK